MPWPTPATTHGRYRLGSATRTSSTRCVTPNLRRIDLRTSGDNRRSRRAALTAPAKGRPKKKDPDPPRGYVQPNGGRRLTSSRRALPPAPVAALLETARSWRGIVPFTHLTRE